MGSGWLEEMLKYALGQANELAGLPQETRVRIRRIDHIVNNREHMGLPIRDFENWETEMWAEGWTTWNTDWWGGESDGRGRRSVH